MRPIGVILFIFGISAILWWFMKRVPWLMKWIYEWGETPAWAIKVSFVVVGILLFIMGGRLHSTQHRRQQ